MLIGPLFQILFFSYLGRYSGVEDDAFIVVGNAVQASAMSGVFAATMAIANERQFQTLSRPCSPQPQTALRSSWAGRCR